MFRTGRNVRSIRNFRTPMIFVTFRSFSTCAICWVCRAFQDSQYFADCQDSQRFRYFQHLQGFRGFRGFRKLAAPPWTLGAYEEPARKYIFAEQIINIAPLGPVFGIWAELHATGEILSCLKMISLLLREAPSFQKVPEMALSEGRISVCAGG